MVRLSFDALPQVKFYIGDWLVSNEKLVLDGQLLNIEECSYGCNTWSMHYLPTSLQSWTTEHMRQLIANEGARKTVLACYDAIHNENGMIRK